MQHGVVHLLSLKTYLNTGICDTGKLNTGLMVVRSPKKKVTKRKVDGLKCTVLLLKKVRHTKGYDRRSQWVKSRTCHCVECGTMVAFYLPETGSILIVTFCGLGVCVCARVSGMIGMALIALLRASTEARAGMTETCGRRVELVIDARSPCVGQPLLLR